MKGDYLVDINSFISSNVYIVSFVLFIIGLIMKNTPKVPNWSIPYVLCILGIIFCNIILGLSLNSSLQGVLTAGIAVYVHQLGKQGIVYASEKGLIKSDKSENDESDKSDN